MSFKDPKKASVLLCSFILAACAGLLIYAVISGAAVWAFIAPGAFLLFAVLVLVAARNRRTTLRDDGFTYRTWLGNEYDYSYKDVVWYRLAEHDVWVYTRDRRLVVDTDSENGLELAKKLKAFGIPDKNPEVSRGIADSAGEVPHQVSYLDQRKTVFWGMLIMTAILLVLGLGLIVYGAARGDAFVKDPVKTALWLAGTAAFSTYTLYIALRSLNTRVEMYKDRFVYRNAFCKRRVYSYKDCVSRREKRFQNTKRFHARITMNDGRKLFVDDRILNEGFGAAVAYKRLPKG